MRSKTMLMGVIGVVIGLLLAAAGIVLAGSLNPGNPPASTSSYALENIYQRLNAGTAGAQSTFTEPSSGPGTGTMHTLDEIMDKAPAVDNTNGATVVQVLTGKSFWGLTASQWATQTGTMPDNGAVTLVPTMTAQTIAAGYHNGSGMVQGDTDLTAGNIQLNVNLFGVTGTLSGGGSTYNAAVPKTGQTISYTLRDDGDLEKGVAWPNPRFITSTTGVVTDTLTGLIWLKNANCFGTKTWETALTSANALASSACGLTDGSVAGDWRLPNVREMQSLIDYGRSSPALPSGHPFTNVQSNYYWASTTYPSKTTYVFYVDLDIGNVYSADKLATSYVWAVRGGQ